MKIYLVLLNLTLDGLWEASSTCFFLKEIIFVSQNLVMKKFHYSLSESLTQF